MVKAKLGARKNVCDSRNTNTRNSMRTVSACFACMKLNQVTSLWELVPFSGTSPRLLRVLVVMMMRVHLFRRWSWGGRRKRWRVSAHVQSHLLGWQWARVQFPVPSPVEAWEGRGCFSLLWLQCKKKGCWISLQGKEVFQNKVEPLTQRLLWCFYMLCSVKLWQYC